MIKNSQPYGPLDPASLAAFEAQIGCSLPPDYRQYLLDHNGGEPSPGHFDFGNDGSLINVMYGLHDGPEFHRLDHVRRFYRGRIPDDFLAICCDPGGNEVCICLHGNHRGSIYFWDHETRKLTLIAPSFEEFLAKLYEWVDPNEHSFYRICRTHDMAEIERFVQSGVDLDTTDEDDRTLLEIAVMFGHADMVERLHAAGASLRNARRYAEDKFQEKRAEMTALIKKLEKRRP